MHPVNLPSDLQQAIVKASSWPANSIYRSTNTYPTTLNAFKARLDAAEQDLFEDDDFEWEVPIRDLPPAAGEKLATYNAHDEKKLRDWLKIETLSVPNDPNRQTITAGRKDPKCRFIYIHGVHSRAPLRLNRAMLTFLMTYHQVMPAYLDFILVFGAQSEPRDLRFSGFREQTMISSHTRGLQIPRLGRSGRQYQLCYNLKSVALKTEDPEDLALNEWSIRQAAFHHQFDVEEGTSLWIVTKGNEDLLERFTELTGKGGRPEDKSFGTAGQCFRSSLATHLLFCHWSTEDWRFHILWVETVIENATAMALYGPRGPGYHHQQYRPRHIQEMQRWADKANEIIMVLESNVDVMTSLRLYYEALKENPDFPLKSECGDDIRSFAAQVNDIISDFKMQISRAKLLVRIVNDRKELILQHLSSQASERMESVSYHMAREAIVMRIVTIVTLIYLPATFVSTFFSTDIIKYQNQDQDGSPGDGTFSSVAMTRWLQVTLPLTIVTLTIAWIALRLSDRRIAGGHDVPSILVQKLPKKKKGKKGEQSLLPLYNKTG